MIVRLACASLGIAAATAVGCAGDPVALSAAGARSAPPHEVAAPPLCPSKIAHHAAPSSPPPPPGWLLAAAPIHGSETLACANLSRSEWSVEATSGNAHVAPRRPLRDDDAPSGRLNAPAHVAGRRVRAVEGGALVGWTQGRGAVLEFVPLDGTPAVELATGTLIGFSAMRTGLVAFMERSRGGIRAATVLRLARDAKGAWSATPWIDLGGGVDAVLTESPESTLVLSTTGLDRLTACGDLARIGSTDYDVLYPDSLAVDASGIIYVGMRHFVTRWVPAASGTYREEWLTKQGCALLSRQKFECVCRG